MFICELEFPSDGSISDEEYQSSDDEVIEDPHGQLVPAKEEKHTELVDGFIVFDLRRAVEQKRRKHFEQGKSLTGTPQSLSPLKLLTAPKVF